MCKDASLADQDVNFCTQEGTGAHGEPVSMLNAHCVSFVKAFKGRFGKSFHGKMLLPVILRNL